MVRSNVQQNSNIGTEIVHIVKLEGTQFDDVILVWILCHLECQRITDITSQTSIISSLLENVVYQRGCSGFSIRTSDADHLGIGIATSKLNFADDVDAFCNDFLDDRSCIGDAWALDDLVGIENLLLCMLTFFPFYLVIVEQLLVFVANLGHVGNKHVETFFLGKDSGSGSAFACT